MQVAAWSERPVVETVAVFDLQLDLTHIDMIWYYASVIAGLRRCLHSLRDLNLYQLALNLQASLGANEIAPPVDDGWIQQIHSKNQSQRNKLEVELKTYQSNMIKESIRVGSFKL